jgi:hypothetical protein
MLDRRRIFRWWRRRGKSLVPRRMMRIAAKRDQRFDGSSRARRHIGLAEIAAALLHFGLETAFLADSSA